MGGKKLGRFHIQRKVGAGAFGTVYHAHDPRLDRSVALKVPRAGTLDAKEGDAFLQESRAAARLRHPNIVAVYDAGQVGGSYYIASAFIESGHTLKDRLLESEHEPSVVVEWIESLADALEYAHSLGVIHRDIKPDNILLDGHDNPNLADFGLAMRIDLDAKADPAGIVGTPAYMSPEQYTCDGHRLDGRSDLWSLGVVMYEALCGVRPFDGDSLVQLRHAIQHTTPIPPSQINPGIPEDLDAICMKCLSREPSERYQSCAALRDDLRRWQRNEVAIAYHASALEHVTRWCQRNHRVAVLGTVVLCCLILASLVAGTVAAQLGSMNTRLIHSLEQLQAEQANLDTVTASAESERRKLERSLERMQTTIKRREAAQVQIVEAKQLREAKREKQRHLDVQIANAEAELSTKDATILKLSEKVAESAQRAQDAAQFVLESGKELRRFEQIRKDQEDEPEPEPAPAEESEDDQESKQWRERLNKAQDQLRVAREDAIANLDTFPQDRRAWEWHYVNDQCRSKSSPVVTLRHAGGKVHNLVVSSDGRQIAHVSNGNEIHAYDISQRALQWNWSIGTPGRVGVVDLAIEGDVVAVISAGRSKDGFQVGNRRRVAIYKLGESKHKEVFRKECPGAKRVWFHPNGKELLILGSKETWRVDLAKNVSAPPTTLKTPCRIWLRGRDGSTIVRGTYFKSHRETDQVSANVGLAAVYDATTEKLVWESPPRQNLWNVGERYPRDGMENFSYAQVDSWHGFALSPDKKYLCAPNAIVHLQELSHTSYPCPDEMPLFFSADSTRIVMIRGTLARRQTEMKIDLVPEVTHPYLIVRDTADGRVVAEITSLGEPFAWPIVATVGGDVIAWVPKDGGSINVQRRPD